MGWCRLVCFCSLKKIVWSSSRLHGVADGRIFNDDKNYFLCSSHNTDMASHCLPMTLMWKEEWNGTECDFWLGCRAIRSSWGRESALRGEAEAKDLSRSLCQHKTTTRVSSTICQGRPSTRWLRLAIGPPSTPIGLLWSLYLEHFPQSQVRVVICCSSVHGILWRRNQARPIERKVSK